MELLFYVRTQMHCVVQGDKDGIFSNQQCFLTHLHSYISSDTGETPIPLFRNICKLLRIIEILMLGQRHVRFFFSLLEFAFLAWANNKNNTEGLETKEQ